MVDVRVERRLKRTTWYKIGERKKIDEAECHAKWWIYVVLTGKTSYMCAFVIIGNRSTPSH